MVMLVEVEVTEEETKEDEVVLVMLITKVWCDGGDGDGGSSGTGAEREINVEERR